MCLTRKQIKIFYIHIETFLSFFFFFNILQVEILTPLTAIYFKENSLKKSTMGNTMTYQGTL